jgi:hypothetical protein
VQVACATEWQEARKYEARRTCHRARWRGGPTCGCWRRREWAGAMKATMEHDWTYSTDYRGTLSGLSVGMPGKTSGLWERVDSQRACGCGGCMALTLGVGGRVISG